MRRAERQSHHPRADHLDLDAQRVRRLQRFANAIVVGRIYQADGQTAVVHRQSAAAELDRLHGGDTDERGRGGGDTGVFHGRARRRGVVVARQDWRGAPGAVDEIGG